MRMLLVEEQVGKMELVDLTLAVEEVASVAVIGAIIGFVINKRKIK